MLFVDPLPQVRRIVDALAAAPVGGIISHAALSAAAGSDVTERRHWIASALRMAQRETGAVFVAERGIGYRRLTVDELPGVGTAARKHIRVSARKASKAIVAGLRGANDVPEAVKLRASAELAVMGLVEHLSRDKTLVKHEVEPAPEAVAEVARTTMMRLQQAITKAP